MHSFLEKIARGYVGFVSRHKAAFTVLVLLVFASSFYLASGLKLRSSLKELLPENSQSVVELDRMLARVGGTSVLTVAIESPDADANMRFVDDLEKKLDELPKDEVRYVMAKVDEIREFYEDNMLHYIDYDDLVKLYSRIKRLVDYEKFKRTPFFLELGGEEPPLSLRYDDIEERNRDNVKMPLAVYKDYYGGEDGRFLIVMIRPQGTAIAIDKARALIGRVKGIVGGLDPRSYAAEMKVGYCGNLVTTVEEYDTLKKDMFSTAALCIFLVCGVIAIYFLRIRIVAFLGATLLIGITFTFAITRLAIGYLNAQTAFLASIIIGTGINYGIILMGRYLEERKGGARPRPAMEHALANSAIPTFLAAATTAVSFSILMIAGVRGFSQFGFIGSIGVILCWISTMLFLPLMVLISERVLSLFRRLSEPKRKSALFPEMDRALSHSPTVIVIAFAVISVVAAVVVYRYIPNSIEYDFSKLRNRISAVEGTEALERRVAKLWVGSMTPAVVLLNQAEDGPVVCEAVMRQNGQMPPAERMVDSCVNVYDLLPKDQERKAGILKRYERLLSESWVNQVSGRLGRQIAAMKKSLGKLYIGIEDLPKDLVRNFEDLDGNVGTFAFINPRSGMPLTNGRNLIRFANTITDIELPDGSVVHATGESLIFSDLIKIVKREAPILVLASFLAVSFFVLIIVRRMSESYVIIISLVWVVLVMVGAMAVFGIKVNFFNFIALPLTFGVGVDYAINIAMRFHEKQRSRTYDILRHTGGAVALCASTTIIGYSVLTRSTNQAVAQFGVMAVIGEVACILSAMLLVPAVIILSLRLKKKRALRKKRLELCEETNP